jgi:hypothetical protein
MSYRDRLSPWCIIQHLPKMQRSAVARFRKRNDAEAHLRALQRLNPAQRYEIVFDPPPDDETSDALDAFADASASDRWPGKYSRGFRREKLIGWQPVNIQAVCLGEGTGLWKSGDCQASFFRRIHPCLGITVWQNVAEITPQTRAVFQN